MSGPLPATAMRAHPAARWFSKAAREAVAHGDPFARRYQCFRVRSSDGRDILAALLLYDGHADVLTAGGSYAARIFGIDPEQRPVPRDVRDLNDLSDRCDAGEYADRDALRRALLGE
jgi:hypothetical protein